MGGVLSPAGPYPDNPLVGNRPMKYPYTVGARIAQYPYKFMWRYCPWYRFYWYAAIPNMYIFYKLQKLSFSPTNVEKWKKTEQEWYGVKLPPEYDLY